MSDRHVTTRRGFVATLGFGAVGLYGAWAAYGAAPLPFGGDARLTGSGAAGGHGGHGAGAMSPDSFLRNHQAFLSRFTLSDGSVDPGLAETGVSPERAPSPGHAHGHEPAHGASPSTHPPSAGAGRELHGGHAVAQAHDPAVIAPADVYLLAYRFGFEPGHLRLRTGTPYRFRMLAQDLSHGASLQIGGGSLIMRLRPGIVSERVVTFTTPGEALVYCTVYCGPGHDVMAGRITVA